MKLLSALLIASMILLMILLAVFAIKADIACNRNVQCAAERARNAGSSGADDGLWYVNPANPISPFSPLNPSSPIYHNGGVD